jgi:rhodanese-related sulfurtransferase
MKTVTAQDVKKMRDAGEKFLLVNTLPAENFEKTKIPGAVNIPQDQSDFAERVESQAGGKDNTIVVYCARKDCDSSSQGAAKLEQAGFVDVYDFEEGAEGWQQEFSTKQQSRATAQK